jgi:hypothetical protein
MSKYKTTITEEQIKLNYGVQTLLAAVIIVLPWKVILPFSLKIEACSLESISLLLYCLTHHLPETF